MNKTQENKAPVISVVMPVYNVEEYLSECLDSVINQSLGDMEIICVDDGSTDKTPEILKEYAARDGRIKIITQENGGQSSARNRGAREAKGKYLYFMDSDDIIEPEALELCVTDMENRGLDYICFNAVAFPNAPENAEMSARLNTNYFARTLDEKTVFDGKELFRTLSETKSVIVPTWSCVILLSAFLENELWFRTGVIYEDEAWMFSTLMSMKKCGCINKVLYKYRTRSASITQSEYDYFHSYGAFIAACEIREYIVKHPECINEEDNGLYEYARMVTRQQDAVKMFCTLSEEEKAKRYELEPNERALFEQTVVFPAYIRNMLTLRTSEKEALLNQNAALKKENEELLFKVRKLKKQKRKLKRKIEEITASAAFRIGSVLTFLPEKIKALFKH